MNSDRAATVHIPDFGVFPLSNVTINAPSSRGPNAVFCIADLNEKTAALSRAFTSKREFRQVVINFKRIDAVENRLKTYNRVRLMRAMILGLQFVPVESHSNSRETNPEHQPKEQVRFTIVGHELIVEHEATGAEAATTAWRST